MFGLRSFRIGRIFGIEIEIHASWIVIFALVFLNFAFGGILPAAKTPGSSVLNLIAALVTTILFFSSVVLHELSHSLVGRTQGVEIKRITLFLFGGLAQMTGEAQSAKSEFLMAAAGPASSIVIGLIFGAVYLAAAVAGAPPIVTSPLSYLAVINVALAVFNLVPGFPLDGGRVLRSTIWFFTKSMERATRIATRTGQVFAGLMIAYGMYEVFFIPNAGLSGFWLVLIGWFLWNAAGSSYQQMEITQALQGVKVGQLMTHGLVTAPADVSLQELVDGYFLRYRFGRFPLVEDNRLVATVTLADVRQVPHETWASTKALDVARPVDETDFVSGEATAVDALMKMSSNGRSQLLVREDSQVMGILTRSDVMQALQVRDALRVHDA
jgi:Zn-dependent protease/predicted transcriptional regulator